MYYVILYLLIYTLKKTLQHIWKIGQNLKFQAKWYFSEVNSVLVLPLMNEIISLVRCQKAKFGSFQLVLIPVIPVWWWYLDPWRCYTGCWWGRWRCPPGTWSPWRCTCGCCRGRRRWTSTRSRQRSSRLREKVMCRLKRDLKTSL